MREKPTSDFNAGDAFAFLEEKEGRRPPLKWLLLNKPQDITEEDLHIGGNLVFNLDDNIEDLSFLPYLHVEGNLILLMSKIKKLPEKLVAGRDIVFECNQYLRQFPSHMEADAMIINANSMVDDLPSTMQGTRMNELVMNMNDPLMESLIMEHDLLDYVRGISGIGKTKQLERFISKKITLGDIQPALKNYIRCRGGQCNSVRINNFHRGMLALLFESKVHGRYQKPFNLGDSILNYDNEQKR